MKFLKNMHLYSNRITINSNILVVELTLQQVSVSQATDFKPTDRLSH